MIRNFVFGIEHISIISRHNRADNRAYHKSKPKDETGKFIKIYLWEKLLIKEIVKIYLFKEIDSLTKKLNLKKIMHHIFLLKKAKEIWHNFPNYEEKIKKYGLIAFELR